MEVNIGHTSLRFPQIKCAGRPGNISIILFLFDVFKTHSENFVAIKYIATTIADDTAKVNTTAIASVYIPKSKQTHMTIIIYRKLYKILFGHDMETKNNCANENDINLQKNNN